MTQTPNPHDAHEDALVCPECGEPVLPRAPSSWPPALGPAPAHSHLDGQPLCPVVGPHGYQPAYPVRHPPAPTLTRPVGDEATEPVTGPTSPSARPGADDTDDIDES